jgi:hypothetical protein
MSTSNAYFVLVNVAARLRIQMVDSSGRRARRTFTRDAVCATTGIVVVYPYQDLGTVMLWDFECAVAKPGARRFNVARTV